MIHSEPIRCLIADDLTVVREGLAAILGRDDCLTVVGMAGNGREALELFRQHRPNITLMDMRMPEMDGAEATIAIRKEFPQARIIMVTGYDGDEDIFRAMNAGAKGYLRKDTPKQELLQAIYAVHQGQTILDPDLTARLMRYVCADNLTPREREVLKQMAQGQSNQEIASGLAIAESTVKTHINSIFAKFGVNDRTQAVLAALRRGLVHLP